jgi:selenide,water dikinase
LPSQRPGNEANVDTVNLTMACEHSGCAAKVSADMLEQVVDFWQPVYDSNVELGLTEKDDVAAYDLGGENLLLHSIDVITPIVDDGFTFGAIAVSHALSDIYAKGGTPVSALSFLGIPHGIASSVQKIVAGCSSKLREAGVILLGGHTISSSELLVGFAVTGLVDRNSLIQLSGACIGDKLILTKPIGSGIISTAVKFSHLGIEDAYIAADELSDAEKSMELLNNYASKAMLKHHGTACTDITGFGLVGHISHLVRASGVGAHIFYRLVPKLPGVTRLFQQSIIPTRLDENIKFYYGHKALKTGNVDANWPILFCPETSGGLLITINENQAEGFVKSVNDLGSIECTIIGEIVDDPSCRVIIDY